MSQPHPFRATLWLFALFGALLCPAMGKSPTAGKDKPLISIVCVSNLDETQEVSLPLFSDIE